MRVVFLAFPGFQLLDVTGPAAVFGAAADAKGLPPQTAVVSVQGGTVPSNCGIAVETVSLPQSEPIDALFVVGGTDDGLAHLVSNFQAREWFCAQARQARLFGSICSGAAALAAWGLADGLRVTTHWNDAAALSSRYPAVRFDADAMFINEGRLWTSAGVTAGIDMALAIVSQIHGPAIAGSVARRLVLSVRRAGHQSQYSPLLDAQSRASGRYGDLIGRVATDLQRRWDIEAMAELAGETPRTFFRNFRAAMGETPAAYVAAIRLDQARILLGSGEPVKRTAALCGYSSPEHFAKSFRAAFGISPVAWQLHNRCDV